MMRSTLDLIVTPRACRGYALMAALLALVVVSMAAAVAIGRARTDALRDKEAQLLWVGGQFRAALRSYHDVNPAGGAQQYPRTLEDLVDDRRGASVRRHLRRVYADPFTGRDDWVLEMDAERIVGLHSSDGGLVLRRANLGPGNDAYAAAATHAQWRFLAVDAPAASAAASPGMSNPEDSQPAPPEPPPLDPFTTAREQCFAQWGAPSLRCQGPDFPFGTDRRTCIREDAALLDACLAPLGGR